MDIIVNKPITKEDLTTASIDLLDKLDKGEISPLSLLQRIKAVAKLEEMIKPVLTDLAVKEALKHPKGPIELYGSEFKLGEFGTKFSFEACGDPVYKRLLEAFEEAKKALKEREDFLKSIKGSETIVDPETAEIATVYAAVKTSTTSVSVTIK